MAYDLWVSESQLERWKPFFQKIFPQLVSWRCRKIFIVFLLTCHPMRPCKIKIVISLFLPLHVQFISNICISVWKRDSYKIKTNSQPPAWSSTCTGIYHWTALTHFLMKNVALSVSYLLNLIYHWLLWFWIYYGQNVFMDWLKCLFHCEVSPGRVCYAKTVPKVILQTKDCVLPFHHSKVFTNFVTLLLFSSSFLGRTREGLGGALQS